MRLISIVTPCYNEAENVKNLYYQVKSITDNFPQYKFEHIFIDNASTDDTVKILKTLPVKIIVNARNFGHIRSPFYGITQARGDAVITLAADLQEPPALIRNFIEHWQKGYKIIVGIKPQSQEFWLLAKLRRLYYFLLANIAETPVVKNFTGFGLYDKAVVDELRQRDDNYPYFRGLIAELGYEVKTIAYIQPQREHGKSKNNFLTLFDMAMLGLTSQSKIPIRSAMFFSLFVFLFGLIKLNIYIMLLGIQFMFIGVLGEYVIAIHRQVFKRPLVIEKERINFEEIK